MTTSSTRTRLAIALASATLMANVGILQSPTFAVSGRSAATNHSVAEKVPGKPKVDCASKIKPKAQAKCNARVDKKAAAKAAKRAAKLAKKVAKTS